MLRYRRSNSGAPSGGLLLSRPTESVGRAQCDAHPSSLVFSSVRLGGVFDDDELMPARKFQNPAHVSRVAVEVHGDDRFRAWTDFFLNSARRAVTDVAGEVENGHELAVTANPARNVIGLPTHVSQSQSLTILGIKGDRAGSL